jgi:multiple sugar transport system permease protein
VKIQTLHRLRRHEERLAWLFVAPVGLGILIFQAYPVLFSLYASLTKWNLISAPRWAGLQNYVELFTEDRYFFKILGNTGTYALGTVLPGIALGIGFALLLNQDIAGRFVYRAIYFIPVVAPTVALGLLWQWIYEPNFGILNSVLKVFGIQGPSWLGSTQWAMRSMVVFAVWQGLGFSIVIFLSGLQSISPDYHEAAAIDGANALQRLLYITLPLLSPVTFFMLVTNVIGALQVFDVPYILTRGGPANATQTAVMYLYGHAFRNQHMGYASAIAYILFVAIVILTILNFALGRRWVFYEEAR